MSPAAVHEIQQQFVAIRQAVETIAANTAVSNSPGVPLATQVGEMTRLLDSINTKFQQDESLEELKAIRAAIEAMSAKLDGLAKPDAAQQYPELRKGNRR